MGIFADGGAEGGAANIVLKSSFHDGPVKRAIMAMYIQIQNSVLNFHSLDDELRQLLLVDCPSRVDDPAANL